MGPGLRPGLKCCCRPVVDVADVAVAAVAVAAGDDDNDLVVDDDDDDVVVVVVVVIIEDVAVEDDVEDDDDDDVDGTACGADDAGAALPSCCSCSCMPKSCPNFHARSLKSKSSVTTSDATHALFRIK